MSHFPTADEQSKELAALILALPPGARTKLASMARAEHFSGLRQIADKIEQASPDDGHGVLRLVDDLDDALCRLHGLRLMTSGLPGRMDRDALGVAIDGIEGALNEAADVLKAAHDLDRSHPVSTPAELEFDA